MTSTMLTAMFLMIVLGARHGIDPEHIAVVNGATTHAVRRGRRWPQGTGFWFALGHGLVITVGALLFVGVLTALPSPRWLIRISLWLPTLILIAVGALNLRELMQRASGYEPAQFKQRLLPERLRDASSPLAMFLVGILFAPFVDPASQAAVWAYVASEQLGLGSVVLLGGVLTAAMAATCVLEAHALVWLMRHEDPQRVARNARRVGWLITLFCFLMAGYTGAEALLPESAPLTHTLLASAAIALASGIGSALVIRHLGARKLPFWRRRRGDAA